MVTYDTAQMYVQSKTTLEEKLAAVEAIMDSLLLMAADSAGSSNYSEYYLDDGQTKISTKYRSVMDVQAGIFAFERLRQMYLNRLNGRVLRLVDSKNFRGCR